MKEVILNGFLGDKYGKHWTIQANTISDVFSCIEANYPLFRKDVIEMVNSGADVDIQCGHRLIDEEDLLFSIPEDSIIITPVPAGAKSGGAKILAAIAIITVIAMSGGFAGAGLFGAPATAGTATQAATAAGLNMAGKIGVLVATNLAMAGITQLMAPDVEAEKQDERNYLFDGPQNTIPQNNIVPVLMGEMIVGGVIIASATVSGLENRTNTFVVTYPTDTDGTDPNPVPSPPPPPPDTTPTLPLPPGPGGPNDGVTDITSVPGGIDNTIELDSR